LFRGKTFTLSNPASATSQQLDGVRVLVLFGGSHLYGQERANLEVFRSLAPLGLKARFLTSNRSGRDFIEPELDRLGFEWTRARFGYQWTRHMLGKHFGYFLLNLWGIVATSWKVWREIQRWRPTHIYCPNWLYFSYAWPALALSRLPLVYRAGDELPLHTGIHRWLTRQLVRRINALVCISHFIASRCVVSEADPRKSVVIHNYPPHRAAAPPQPLPAAPAGAMVIAYVGQITEHKGVGVLVEAVTQMLRAGDNLVLWIAGQSTWGVGLEETLRAQVAAAGLGDRIQFFGYVENVPSLLAASHLHVCPSIWPEPLTNVVLEAKQAGVPSVVFPVGGIPELVEHQVDGYVCADVTTESLVQGLRYFLDQPERRVEAGRRARASLDEKFGHDRFVRQWAGVFLGTLNER
jgi:glycosyltransferase involved in cell wall biosynthesis